MSWQLSPLSPRHLFLCHLCHHPIQLSAAPFRRLPPVALCRLLPVCTTFLTYSHQGAFPSLVTPAHLCLVRMHPCRDGATHSLCPPRSLFPYLWPSVCHHLPPPAPKSRDLGVTPVTESVPCSAVAQTCLCLLEGPHRPHWLLYLVQSQTPASSKEETSP